MFKLQTIAVALSTRREKAVCPREIILALVFSVLSYYLLK